MCGIAGLLSFGDADAVRGASAVQAMLDRLRHRGPDGSGQWGARTPSGWIGLAHARLAILDLSPAAAQPMRRGTAVVAYNGEIYNFRELRHELEGRGARFETSSDTEVLLAAYERWGDAVVDRLRGMFAFGLWDAARARLLLARDRLGIKPLYYCVADGAVAFASEIRALLASGVIAPTLDARSLWTYLGYQTAATPATLVHGVSMLEPGHTLAFDASGRRASRRYWDFLQTAGTAPPLTSASARQRIRDAFADAVVSHTVSDVPIGVFLSSGIDSGAVLSALAAHGVRARTFTVAFGDPSGDESAAAASIARAFDADHTTVPLSEASILETLPRALAAIDHPSGDGVNAFVVAEAVRHHGISVALSGLGGDELFGGYPSFRRLRRLAPAASHWGRSPRRVRQLAAGLVRAGSGESVAGTRIAEAIESDGSVASLWPVTRQLFSERDRQALLPETFGMTTGADPYRQLIASAAAERPAAGAWTLTSFAESRAYMHDVLLRDADQMSMAHAVEVRVPLLDHRLVELVVSLPEDVVGRGRPKSLLADSLERPLPAAVVGAPKRGFTLPFDAWMRGALRPFCEAQLGDHGLDGRGILRPGAARALWQSFLDRRRGVTWTRVWTLVALNAWLERTGISGDVA